MKARQIIFSIVVTCLFFNLASQDMFDICPLKVGESAPEVDLTNTEGKEMSLASILDNKPGILIFYRGAWCGYCTKHLADLNAIKSDVENLGYQMIGITVDKAEKLDESIDKAGEEIVVYSDSDLQAIRAFGLNWNVGDELYDKYKNSYELDLEEWSGEQHHELPVPAIYIIKDGQVEFQYVNPKYSTRFSAGSLLALLKTM